MRSYIFTNVERKILAEYLRIERNSNNNRKKKHRHFNVLSYLIRRNKRTILEDVKLMNIVADGRLSSSSSNSRSKRKRR